MQKSQNTYTHFVNWFKVLFPLAALALLSTMFLFARDTTSTSEIPFAEIEAVARDQSITAPYFAGVTTSGATVSLAAISAAPDRENGAMLIVNRPLANLVSNTGAQVEVIAGNAVLDTSNRSAELEGLARITTSNGYKMETTGLSADFANGRFESHGPLEVRAPFGDLQAGKMIVGPDGPEQTQQINFQDGVRLVYHRAATVTE